MRLFGSSQDPIAARLVNLLTDDISTPADFRDVLRELKGAKKWLENPIESDSCSSMWHLAASRRQGAAMLQVLMDALRSSHGLTADQPTTPHFDSLVIKLLSSRDKQGRTSLCRAIQSGSSRSLRVILNWMSPGCKNGPLQMICLHSDKQGRTPLMLAARVRGEGGRNMVALILDWVCNGGRLSLPDQTTPPTEAGGEEEGLNEIVGGSSDEESGPGASPLASPLSPHVPSTSTPSLLALLPPITPSATLGSAGQSDHSLGTLPSRHNPPHLTTNRAATASTPLYLQHKGRKAAAKIATLVKPCTQGPSCQCRQLVKTLDQSGLSALHFASASDSHLACQMLLERGAIVSTASSSTCYESLLPCDGGATPLHIAAQHNSHRAASTILNFWAQLSTEDKMIHWDPKSHSSHMGGSRPFDTLRSSSSSNLMRKREGRVGGFSDPRSIEDRGNLIPRDMARSRRNEALADLLDPSTPLVTLKEGVAVIVGGDEGSLPVPPSFYCCPITMDLMKDPVVASDGNSYERAAIQKWLESNGNSPLSNLPLSTRSLFANRALKQAIEAWSDLARKHSEPSKRGDSSLTASQRAELFASGASGGGGARDEVSRPLSPFRERFNGLLRAASGVGRRTRPLSP